MIDRIRKVKHTHGGPWWLAVVQAFNHWLDWWTFQQYARHRISRPLGRAR